MGEVVESKYFSLAKELVKPSRKYVVQILFIKLMDFLFDLFSDIRRILRPETKTVKNKQ